MATLCSETSDHFNQVTCGQRNKFVGKSSIKIVYWWHMNTSLKVCLTLKALTTYRLGSTLRWGNCPQTSALPPKCDMKHCLTKLKHQHIGAKGAFCGLQNTPKCFFGRGSALDHTGDAHEVPPDALVRWRRDIPPHTPPYSVPQFSCLSWLLFSTLTPPNISLSNRACQVGMHMSKRLQDSFKRLQN